jgi:hypothetical protein
MLTQSTPLQRWPHELHHTAWRLLQLSHCGSLDMLDILQGAYRERCYTVLDAELCTRRLHAVAINW